MFRISFIPLMMVLSSGCSFKPSTLNFDDLSLRPGDSSVESRIQMGDRFYVRSVLSEVFDMTEAEAALVGQKFSFPFGGACDYSIRNEASVPQDRGCGYYPKQTVLPGSGPERSAIMVVACDDILNNNLYLHRAMVKIHPAWPLYVNGVLEEKPEYKPNAASVAKAYQFFYPQDEPDPKVVEALLAVGNKFTANASSWRNILSTICYSPDWQSP